MVLFKVELLINSKTDFYTNIMDTSNLLWQPHVFEQCYKKMLSNIRPQVGATGPIVFHNTGHEQGPEHRCQCNNERAMFTKALSHTRWEYLYTLATCEEQFSLFQETMDYLLGTCFPYVTVSRHNTDKPWIPDGFRHLIRQRQPARMSGDMEQARRLKNLVNRTAPKLRHQFYQKQNRNTRGIIET